MTPAGSQGGLLLGGTIGAYAAPGRVQQAGADGVLELSIDPSAISRRGAFEAAVAGDLWTFQAWYRDANPGSTSNLTRARTIAFL